MMRSLRARLLTGIIGGMVLLLTIFSLLLYVLISRASIHQFDVSLASICEILAAAVERDGDQFELDLAVQQMPEFRNTGQPTYYELRRLDGTIVAKSPLLGTRDLPRVTGTERKGVFIPLQVERGEFLRAMSMAFVPRVADREGEQADLHPGNGEALALAVAHDAGDLQRQLQSLRWLLAATSTVVLGLSLIIGAMIVGQGLRPLRLIATEIAAIKASDLTARIGVEPAPTELAPIKDRLNELLSGLEASFNRERQFNADVAHELRTPLAGIRSTIEVTLARTRDSADYRTALSDCLEITEGMQSIVSNLLMLARLEARQITFKTEDVRLAELVNTCWRPFADRASRREIILENGIAADVVLPSDREHLSMVLTNLLDNAAEYADEGGHVWTNAQRADDALSITVSNTGCQLTAEQVAHVFDSFWRGDSSRLGTGTHCGLGLALVQRLVGALGGHVTAELQPGGIFVMQLSFPARA
jgi:two-component system, OmpR family, heavy metal sensor histidine kinase CusS